MQSTSASRTTKRQTSKAKSKAQSPVAAIEEFQFRSENAFCSVIINRRTKLMRVFDFRAGALPAKRLFIQTLAKREGIYKAIMLVEKDEVASWTRIGFIREGVVSGFYKRSDGYLLGCIVGDKADRTEIDDSVAKVSERTINAAKKLVRDPEAVRRGITTQRIDHSVALAARDAHWSKGLALATFDAFGRDSERAYFEITMAKTKPNYWFADYQDCFGHSLLELLRAPVNEDEFKAALNGLTTVTDDFLKPRGIVSGFGFTPVDSVPLATLYLSAGFRKTGLVAGGTFLNGTRVDAILWTKKLANPATEDDFE